MDWERNMPLLICLGIDNYAHAQTVDTRPFFLGWVGPGNEAIHSQTLDVLPSSIDHSFYIAISSFFVMPLREHLLVVAH